MPKKRFPPSAGCLAVSPHRLTFINRCLIRRFWDHLSDGRPDGGMNDGKRPFPLNSPSQL
ncbi:MAG: hypothetical protein H6668_22355 [Ardenticatenaceae bacterium]|nr:hypothetical protein [Ardenticatenaceae bacterium]